MKINSEYSSANSGTSRTFDVLRPAACELKGIVGTDPAMRRVYEIVQRVADTRTTVLITGESGTGKSLLARAIHHVSRRAKAPFIEVSCGALTETLLESELFGHEAGAFTGAVSRKMGRFAQADGGTIFLDEIGTASKALQIKLLRVLQDFEFEPVGSTKTVRVNTRVILATNENLEQAVAEGRFRQDLYYRINVINLEIPPLRLRPSDIPQLAEYFLQKTNQECEREIRGFAPETLRLLTHYRWPGNVRELQNAVERMVLLGSAPWILPEDLPPQIAAAPSSERLSQNAQPSQNAENSETFDFSSDSRLKGSLSIPERQLILDALEQNNWSRTRTAAFLGINRTTLYKKMKKFHLTRPCENAN